MKNNFRTFVLVILACATVFPLVAQDVVADTGKPGENLSPAERFRALNAIAVTHASEGNLVELQKAVDALLAQEGAVGLKTGRLQDLGKLAMNKRAFAQAADALTKLAAMSENLKVPQRLALYRDLATAQRQTGAAPELRVQTAAGLRAVLEEMAGAEKLTPQEQLVLQLEAAGTYGLADNAVEMNRVIEEALAKHKELDVAAVVEAFHTAALFYMVSRDYEVVQVLKGRGDAIFDRARVRNSYTCRFSSPLPVDAGSWAQSAFVKDSKNKETRFHSYPRGQEEIFRTDMAVDRPLDEKVQAAMEGRETAFFMAYDAKGWHMYIQSNEPDIEQVMLEDGRRGSTLEMFFSPGQEGETYYQWIIRLATGEVSLYNYNTPHRFYRHLEDKPGSFQADTVALEKGWGTSIFIPWESLYDKLPFMTGNASTWRFSIMRWGPVSLTWGGKVHEPGRWGLIEWQPPTPKQRLEIQRYIIKRAWWKYQVVKQEALDFWQGSRGDADFYQKVLEPVIATHDAFGEQMKDVDEWDLNRMDEVYKRHVPEWMEFKYTIEELRSKYLEKNLEKT